MVKQNDRVKLPKQGNVCGEVKLIHYSENSCKPHKASVLLDKSFGGFVVQSYICDMEVIK